MMRVDRAAAEVLDAEGTLNRFGGDTDLFREMASIVLADAPQLARALTDSVDARDAQAIQMRAHAIKGLVIGCGGACAAKIAQKLEDAGRDGKLSDVAEQLAVFKIELQRFLDALRAHPYTMLAGDVG
jgi:HPt (histidine-containing phosphotransfer) domain-containing protein